MKLLIYSIVAVVAAIMALFVGLALYLLIVTWNDRSAAETADLVLDLASVSMSEAVPTRVPASAVLPSSVAIICNFGPYASLAPRWYEEDLDLISQAAEGIEFAYLPPTPMVGEHEALSVYYDEDRAMIGHDWFKSYALYHRQHWAAVFSNRSVANDAEILNGCANSAEVSVEISAGTRARYIQFLID